MWFKNYGDINIFNSNGTINHHGIHYEGKDRFKVRKEIIEELDNIGLFVKSFIIWLKMTNYAMKISLDYLKKILEKV